MGWASVDATSPLVYDKNTMNMNQYYRIKKTSIDSDSSEVKGPSGLLSTSEAEVFGLWFWRDAIWHNLLVSLRPQGPWGLGCRFGQDMVVIMKL